MRLRRNRRASVSSMTAIMMAVTALAVSIAFGFIVGSPFSARTESLRVYPESRLAASTGEFSLVVSNTGNVDATIVAVRIGNIQSDATFPVTVKAGSQVVLKGALGSGTFKIENPYEIHVYTAVGNDYMGLLVAT